MAGVRGALVFALIWTAACFGSSEDRDSKAAAADGPPIRQRPRSMLRCRTVVFQKGVPRSHTRSGIRLPSQGVANIRSTTSP